VVSDREERGRAGRASAQLGPGEKKMGLLGPRGELRGEGSWASGWGKRRERRLLGFISFTSSFLFLYSKHSNNYLNPNAN
jgi:hypothetical protein